MARRTARLVLLIVLLVIGGAAAAFSAYEARHVDELARSALATSRRVDELVLTLQSVRDAQQAYLVVNGKHPAPDEVTTHLASVTKATTQLHPLVQASRSAAILNGLREDARSLTDVETQAQNYVGLGHDLMAAELISTTADNTLRRMQSALRDFRTAELSAIDVDRSITLQKIWIVIGGAAAFWMLGLLCLVGVPKQTPAERTTAGPPAILSIAEINEPENPAPAPVTPTVDRDRSDDLRQAADLCTAIGQITDARDVEPLLARAASVLGGSGVVVWMAAGEELIAASAYGYDSGAVHRLGRIHRSGLNATAVAWRSGTLQTVRGEGASQAAIVAPMLGTSRCVGVLAIEVPQGTEDDETTQAIARFVAAQLAATLAPWPAASIADSDIATFEKVAEG